MIGVVRLSIKFIVFGTLLMSGPEFQILVSFRFQFVSLRFVQERF